MGPELVLKREPYPWPPPRFKILEGSPFFYGKPQRKRPVLYRWRARMRALGCSNKSIRQWAKKNRLQGPKMLELRLTFDKLLTEAMSSKLFKRSSAP